MSPPSLTVTYFSDAKGRQELSRLILAVGNIPYEDEQIDGATYYKRRQDNNALPFGQLPTLTVEHLTSDAGAASFHKKEEEEKKEEEDAVHVLGLRGNREVFGQSCAIARYVATVAGLYPKPGSVDALRSDAIVDSWRDMLDLFYETVFTRIIYNNQRIMIPHPKSARFTKLQAFVKTDLNDMLSRYEDMLVPAPLDKENHDEEEAFQFCTSMPFPSWADLAVYDLCKTMECALQPTLFETMMETRPKVKAMVRRIHTMECIQRHLEKYPYDPKLRGMMAKVGWVEWLVQEKVLGNILVKWMMHVVVMPVWKKVSGVLGLEGKKSL